MLSRRVRVLTDCVPWWRAGGVPAGACVAAYQPRGTSSLAGSYTNLASPGLYDAAPHSSAPGWDAVSGWIFAANYTLKALFKLANGYSMIFMFSNKANTTGGLGGSYNYTGTTGGMAIFPQVQLVYYAPGSVIISTNVASGVLAISGNTCYRNGIYDGKSTGALPTQNNYFYIGGVYNDATAQAGSLISAKIQAVAVYSLSLTDSQIAAITAAMNAL